jgi:hypothetical protein
MGSGRKKGCSSWMKGLTRETDERVNRIYSKARNDKISEKAKGKFFIPKSSLELRTIKFLQTINDPKWRETTGKDRYTRSALSKKKWWNNPANDKVIKEMCIKLSAFNQGISLSEWKGFTKRDYDRKFNTRFCNFIKNRDNQLCMLCNADKEKSNIVLCVHHIDYNKQLTTEQNCMTLCIGCNAKVNHNRKYWTSFFQNMLRNSLKESQ